MLCRIRADSQSQSQTKPVQFLKEIRIKFSHYHLVKPLNTQSQTKLF